MAGNVRLLKIIGYFLWFSAKVISKIRLTTGTSLGPPIRMDTGVELDAEALLGPTSTLLLLVVVSFRSSWGGARAPGRVEGTKGTGKRLKAIALSMF